MSGTIIEHLSNRKIVVVISIILIIQIISFLVGAFIGEHKSGDLKFLSISICL